MEDRDDLSSGWMNERKPWKFSTICMSTIMIARPVTGKGGNNARSVCQFLYSSQFVKVYSINQPQHQRHSTITFAIETRKIPTFPRRYPIFQKSHTKVSLRSSQIASSRGAYPYDTRARTRQARFHTSGPRWPEQREQGDNIRAVHQNKAKHSQG